MSDIQKGQQVTSAFQYIQQVFKECQRLIFKIDNQLAPEFGNLYGNRITKDVSASLQEPERWLPKLFSVFIKAAKIKWLINALQSPFGEMKLNSQLLLPENCIL